MGQGKISSKILVEKIKMSEGIDPISEISALTHTGKIVVSFQQGNVGV